MQHELWIGKISNYVAEEFEIITSKLFSQQSTQKIFVIEDATADHLTEKRPFVQFLINIIVWKYCFAIIMMELLRH